jgi:hypothetical protein
MGDLLVIGTTPAPGAVHGCGTVPGGTNEARANCPDAGRSPGRSRSYGCQDDGLPTIEKVDGPSTPDARFFVTIYDRILLHLQRVVTLRIRCRGRFAAAGIRRRLSFIASASDVIRLGTKTTLPGIRGTAG